ADADDARARFERAVASDRGRVGRRDDLAGAGLELLVADRERGPPGDHDVDLLLTAVGLVVLDVELLARIAHDGADAESGDAERAVERLPAAVGGLDDGMVGQVDDGPGVLSLLVIASRIHTHPGLWRTRRGAAVQPACGSGSNSVSSG